MSLNRRWRPPSPLVVSLLGLLVVASLVARGLSAFDWDPTIYVGFGEAATETLAYAEERLGDVLVRPELGHDGKFFFVQANDPWLFAPADNAAVLDLPVYRSQRMLYPALAGGLGLLGPEAIVWTLIAVNLAAVFLGTWAAALVSIRVGATPWLGLAFALNIGLIFAIAVDGAGVVAAAAAFGALAAFLDEDWTAGIALLAVSSLTREVMILVALGAAVWMWRRGRNRLAVLALLIPGAAIGAWRIYLLWRLGPDEESASALGPPLVGLAEAARGWVGEPLDLAAGIAMVLVLVLYLRRAVTSPGLLSWAFVGFIPLALLFTEKVWSNYFDHTRAVAPVITALVIAILAKQGEHRGTLDSRPGGVRESSASSRGAA